MSKHRIYVTDPLYTGSKVILDGSQAHYLGHVLRVRPGDVVMLFDGSGPEFESVVDKVSRREVALSVASAFMPATESPLNVTLLQSVLRGERMDFCVQKATELGVHRIVPVITERTVAKIPKNRIEKRIGHWHKTAIAACEQSGRVKVPAVTEPTSLYDAVDGLSADTLVLLFDPWAGAAHLGNLPPPPSRHVAVCIGPEGGYTDEELESLRASGAVSVTCGPRVLRSETAGIIAVAACQMTWGDWSTCA